MRNRSNTHDRASLESIFAKIDNCEDVESAVTCIRNTYGVSHVTLQLAQSVNETIDMPYVRSTYPPSWISRYLLCGYVNLDPVVKMGFRRKLPFDWTEITIDDQAVRVMIESKKFGLGTSGFSIPTIDKSARRALLSINSHASKDEWHTIKRLHSKEWVELAHKLHKRAIYEIYGRQDPAPQLGPREIECLSWTAQGKDYKDIAIIVGISEHTARSYLKSARFKLECATLSQAVAKAIRMRIL